MLEAAAVPALLKAIDWIFGESSKILQERRERAKAENRKLPSAPAHDTSGGESASASSAIRAREAAIDQPIEETLWRNAERHVTHLLALLEIHTANYHLAREQHAKFTSLYAPPVVIHTLTEAENQIVEVTRELQSVLSTIYRRPVTTPELDVA
jgi:hypothetical protein